MKFATRSGSIGAFLLILAGCASSAFAEDKILVALDRAPRETVEACREVAAGMYGVRAGK